MKMARIHVGICARALARKYVETELRDQGVRVSLVPVREINERATAYIVAHPEIWAEALERARRIEEAEEAHKARRRNRARR